MKTLIIRKPKFLRNDDVMKTYIDIGESITKIMDDSKLTTDQKYELLMKLNECLHKAAKAGGFFRTEDFCKWMLTINNS